MQARYLCQVYRTDVIGIWTLMCSLSDGHSVVHVKLKCPLGVMRPITLKFNCNVLRIVLFKEVEKSTDIPTSLQMLTYGMHSFAARCLT